MAKHNPITDVAHAGTAGFPPAPSEAHQRAAAAQPAIVVQLDDDMEVIGASVPEAHLQFLLATHRVLRVADQVGAGYDLYLDMDQQSLICELVIA
jgi:hypothetical protein